MKFSFIHTADIHLGRAFSDISETDEKTNICDRSCQKSFEKIIDTAISKKVDFVLIAGDSFDSEDNDLSAKLIFIRNLKKLADNNIKTYIICGNHDSIELYEKNKSYFKFNNGYEGLINITGITTTDCKATFQPLEGVNIHSLSFKTDEMKNPIPDLPKLNSETEKDFNIGLIHCDLDKQDSKYAPVSREDLRKLGYDYYALGHIHIPEIKEEKIVYAGSPQARTKKETGEHGCYYIEVENSKIKSLEFIPTDFVRFSELEINCSDCENKAEIYEKISAEISNGNNSVELSLFEITLSGVTKSYEELNNTDNILKEYLDNYSTSKNTEVYKINNHTIPFIDEELILKDKGIIGLISQTVLNDNEDNKKVINDIYDNIKDIHENIYKKLAPDKDTKEFLSNSLELEKDKILNSVKNEIKSICSEIYEKDIN